MCSRWKFEIFWHHSMRNMTEYTVESEVAAPWELFITFALKAFLHSKYIQLPNWLSELGGGVLPFQHVYSV